MYVVYAFLYIYAYIIYVNIIWIEIWAGNLNSHRIPCILYETSLFIHLFWWIPRKPQLLPLDIPTPQVERLLFPVGHVCAWGRGGKKIRGLHCLNINCFARFFGFNSWDGILLPFPVLLNIKKKTTQAPPPKTWGTEISQAPNIWSWRHKARFNWATKKTFITFHCTGWIIGILIMVY